MPANLQVYTVGRMQRITIYTTSDCQFCRQLREFLMERGISFLEYNVTEDPEKLAEMRRYSRGASTVPVIVLRSEDSKDTVMVGYEPIALETALSSFMFSSSSIA